MLPISSFQAADNVSGTDYASGGLSPWIYRTSKKVGDSARKGTINNIGKFVGSVLDKGPFVGAASLGGASYLGGLGLGAISDAIGLTDNASRNWSNYAGLAGLLGGGLSGYLRTVKSQSALGGLINAIEADGSVGYQVKQAIVSALRSLGATQQEAVTRAVMSVGVGSVVAAVAKLLVGMGVLPSAILGLLSGAATNNVINYFSGPSSNVDALGRPYYT